jgi:hypothetical protein
MKTTMRASNGPQYRMTARERAIVRYTLAYLATGDGRHARGHAKHHLSRETTRAIRSLANEWRDRIIKP